MHDGDNVVQEQNATGTPTADLLTGLGIDETLASIDSSGTTSLLTDALGSTVALDRRKRLGRDRLRLRALRCYHAGGAASSNGFQFTGRENDGGAAGLYFYRGRYYNPDWGRFISEDPIGFAGGDANLYAWDCLRLG